eukprot:TRINITY_DN3752_c0_g1_i1.p1 TRINITY_DN3752_c0_g1~~TRINITY_DN3752_c0_g1_i1.p1  ORF type:complete len:267 (+),score=67.63 TRINITY_DN3752_c0_g1_i1:219-1019(+)
MKGIFIHYAVWILKATKEEGQKLTFFGKGAGLKGEGEEGVSENEQRMEEEGEGKERILQEPLQLGLEEAFYLVHIDKSLDVEFQGEVLSEARCWMKFCLVLPTFPLSFFVYLHFRTNNWWPRSGVKLGCNFVLYDLNKLNSMLIRQQIQEQRKKENKRRGLKANVPHIHAQYAVTIIDSEEGKEAEEDSKDSNLSLSNWKSIISSNRVIQNVAKEQMMVFVIKPKMIEEKREGEEEEKEKEFSLGIFDGWRLKKICLQHFQPNKEK